MLLTTQKLVEIPLNLQLMVAGKFDNLQFGGFKLSNFITVDALKKIKKNPSLSVSVSMHRAVTLCWPCTVWNMSHSSGCDLVYVCEYLQAICYKHTFTQRYKDLRLKTCHHWNSFKSTISFCKPSVLTTNPVSFIWDVFFLFCFFVF